MQLNGDSPDCSHVLCWCFWTVGVFEVENMKSVLYNTLKSVSLYYCVCSSLHILSSSFSLKLHISLLSAGKKAAMLQQIFTVSPPPQHDWRWLEGETHFPVSKVSQLTKNLAFLCVSEASGQVSREAQWRREPEQSRTELREQQCLL